MSKPRCEIWTLHKKVGNRSWEPAYFCLQYGVDAEDYVRSVAKYLSDKRRKYRAVKYVPTGRKRKIAPKDTNQ